MKVLIKLILGLLLFVAVVNATRAAYTEYEFQDAVHQALLFDAGASDSEVVDTVMKLAAEYELPMAAEDVKLRLTGQERQVAMTYTMDVMLIPGMFSKEWTFTPETSVRIITRDVR